jgi:sigma54-dependent transcription regulator
VLQEREFERVGGTHTLKVDVRVIAATNVEMTREIELGNFREDRFYRLNVLPIKLPALRERAEDAPLLIRHFLKQAGQYPPIGKRNRIHGHFGPRRTFDGGRYTAGSTRWTWEPSGEKRRNRRDRFVVGSPHQL